MQKKAFVNTNVLIMSILSTKHGTLIFYCAIANDYTTIYCRGQVLRHKIVEYFHFPIYIFTDMCYTIAVYIIIKNHIG